MLERIPGDDGAPEEGGHGAEADEGGHVPEVRVPDPGERSTAADVSSHEVSMARTSTWDRPFGGIVTEKALSVRPAWGHVPSVHVPTHTQRTSPLAIFLARLQQSRPVKRNNLEAVGIFRPSGCLDQRAFFL